MVFLLRSIKPDRKSPLVSPACSPCSPNISVGPPQAPPSNPYTNLFSSGLYQQYLGQLLANTNNSNINPMLLQAQLAMASYNNHANLISERLKQNRFSPYGSPPAVSRPESATFGASSPRVYLEMVVAAAVAAEVRRQGSEIMEV